MRGSSPRSTSAGAWGNIHKVRRCFVGSSLDVILDLETGNYPGLIVAGTVGMVVAA
jgi:hypothetical protein